MKKIYLILLICVFEISSAQVNISSSLSACYALNGNGAEPINGLTATLSAITPTLDRLSNPNSAISFSGGIGSYVTLPNNPMIKANAVSFSGWVKTNVNNLTQIFLFAHNGCVSYHEGYQLNYTIVGPTVYRFQATKSTSLCSPGTEIGLMGNTQTITANTWYHVGAYFGPDSIKLYVNGVLDAAVSATLPLNYANAANVYLGGTNLTFNLPLNGSMDNVRIYRRKLNGAEFNSLYVNDQTCLTGFLPVANYSLSPTTPTNNVCINVPINFTDLSTNTPTAWAWQFPGATPSVSTLNNPVITFTNTGTHTVSLISTNGYGASTAYTGTVFASGCLGINENLLENKIEIMPNPNQGIFIVQSIEPINEIIVSDINGKELLRKTENGINKCEINISEFSNGIYFLRMKGIKNVLHGKIIRE